MAELLHVKVIDTGELMDIEDAEPMESAKYFKALSDSIWLRKPQEMRIPMFNVATVMPADEVRDVLNQTLGAIDDVFVISGVDKALTLRGGRGREMTYDATALATTRGAHIGTFNWDSRNYYRVATIEGKNVGVEFTDNHRDYHRELFAGLTLGTSPENTLRLSYSMQRYQPNHDTPTLLSMSAHVREFAETGYEGNQLAHVELTSDQEVSVLRTFQTIGGLTVRYTQ